jgi:hypothetical protein
MKSSEACPTAAEAAAAAATIVLDDIVALATFAPIHTVSPRLPTNVVGTLLRGSVLPQALAQRR